MQAKVEGLFVGLPDTHISVPVDKLKCTLDGIQGDRHNSSSKLAGAQEKHIVLKHRPVANFRQVTIVTQEEMDAVAEALGVPKLYAEDFSANIAISGIEGFTTLPPMYYLVFSNKRQETHAVIRIMGENRPCIVAGENMQKRYPEEKGLKSRFVKAALHKRGQVAVVYASGVIRVGDTVNFVPHQPMIKKR